MPLLKHYLLFLSMYGVGISLALGGLLACLMPRRYASALDPLLRFLTIAAFVLTGACSISYLFFSNFIDHLEPTILQITQLWMQGEQIYPSIDTVSMHGLLYGPALYWIQYPFLTIGHDPIFNSKLPSVIAFNAAWSMLFFRYKNTLAKAYLLMLLPFNLILFWNRAEPYFVLLVALAICIAEKRPSISALALGVLAGLASSLKAHGVLYILPLLLCFGISSVRSVIEFSIAWGLISLSFFLNDGTSFINYLAYLKLAAQHGISWAYLEKNLFFLLLTWLPIAFTFKHAPLAPAHIYRWLGIALIELLVALAGSKPGAGVHHLIPIIVLNSYLYDIQLRKIESLDFKFFGIKLGFIVLALYVLSFVWKNVYDSEIKNQDVITQQGQAVREIQQLGATYPKLLMGVTDKENDNYRLTFLRSYLVTHKAPQFEYAGFMDLNYAGISDQPLREALRTCQYAYVALPKNGAPFSILNFYTNEPLFSEEMRSVFRTHFMPRHRGVYFDIYACQ